MADGWLFSSRSWSRSWQARTAGAFLFLSRMRCTQADQVLLSPGIGLLPTKLPGEGGICIGSV